MEDNNTLAQRFKLISDTLLKTAMRSSISLSLSPERYLRCGYYINILLNVVSPIRL